MRTGSSRPRYRPFSTLWPSGNFGTPRPRGMGSQARRIANASRSSCARARGLGIVRRALNHLQQCVTTLTLLCSIRSYQTESTSSINSCRPGYNDTTTSGPDHMTLKCLVEHLILLTQILLYECYTKNDCEITKQLQNLKLGNIYVIDL